MSQVIQKTVAPVKLIGWTFSAAEAAATVAATTRPAPKGKKALVGDQTPAAPHGGKLSTHDGSSLSYGITRQGGSGPTIVFG